MRDAAASLGRLRILLTVHHALERGTGAPGMTVALAEELERRGHSVEVVGLGLLHHARGSTVDAVRFPRAVARHVGLRLARGEVDVVDASSGDLAWMSEPKVRAADAAVFTRSHGLEPLAADARRRGSAAGELDLRARYRLYHGGYRLFEVRRSLRIADAVLVLNAAEEAYATAALAIAPDRVWRTAPVVADAVEVLPRAPGRDVLVLGAATWRKGGDLALRVLTSVLRADLDATASWAGLDDPDAMKRSLDDDLGDRVATTGRYGPAELSVLLATHKVLLFSSRFEGLPVTLLEALASGIAVVGSDIAGVRDLLSGGAGVVVPVGHVEGLSGAVRALLSNDAAREACAASAAKVTEHYRAPAVVDRLEAAYRAVLSLKRPERADQAR